MIWYTSYELQAAGEPQDMDELRQRLNRWVQVSHRWWIDRRIQDTDGPQAARTNRSIRMEEMLYV